MAKSKKNIEKFTKVIVKKIYYPEQIVDAFFHLAEKILKTLKDSDSNIYARIEAKQRLKNIIDSKTLNEIIAELNLITDQMMKSEARIFKSNKYSMVVTKATNYISSNYMHDISLKKIANHTGVTPEYFCYLFNSETGLSFVKYLKKYRVEKAKKLLLTSDKKEYEIAEEVGYKDPKYFYRVFKQVTNLTPKQYRNTNI